MERWKRCGIPKESSQQSISSGIQTIYDLIDGKLPYAGVPRNLGEYQGTKSGQDSVSQKSNLEMQKLLQANEVHVPMIAMIVKADLRKGQYKFYLGAKSYPGIDELNPLDRWGSPFE